MRIEIEEPQRTSLALAHAALRAVLGVVILSGAALNLASYSGWRERIMAMRIGDPHIANAVASFVLGCAFFAGGALILGLFTRFSAFVAAGVAIVSAAAFQMQHGELMMLELQLPLLTVAAAAFFLAAGSGTCSLDTVRWRRSRRRAIERDRVWSEPPYQPARSAK